VIPRGPIFSEDSDDRPDYTDKYEERMSQWRDAAEEESIRTARLNSELDHIGQYIRFISGEHWSKRRPSYKSKFHINKVGKARIDTLSYLTDTLPIFEISHSRDDLKETAKMVKSAIQYEWTNEDLDMELVDAIDIGLTGTAFWKLGASSPGNTQVIPCGPDSVMPIQPGKHIQKSSAVRYRTWKSLLNVMRMFPFCAAELEREGRTSPGLQGYTYARPSHIPSYVWQPMNPGMKRALGTRINMDEINSGPYRSVAWNEYYVEDYSTNDSNRRVLMRDPYLKLSEHNWWYWVEPGKRLYPRKRKMVFAGKKLVYDGPNPYWHGLYPFSTLRLNPVFYSFWGQSLYRDLIPMNMAQNEIVAGILDAIKLVLNRTMLARQGAAPPAAWKQFFPDMPNATLFMNNNADPSRDIQFPKPPEIPAYVLVLLQQFLGPEFDKMAGLMDVNALAGKLQVPGGDTMEQMKDTMQSGIRLEGRYIEMFLRDAGVQEVSNVIQFYSAARRLQILGEDGFTWDDMQFDPIWRNKLQDEQKFDYWKQFSFRIAPGSLRSGARDRDKQVAISLSGAGKFPTRRLYDVLGVDDADKVYSELLDEYKAGIQGGGGPGSRLTRGQRNGQAA
jgi:hypothetical protein